MWSFPEGREKVRERPLRKQLVSYLEGKICMCVYFATSSSKTSTLLKHSWEQQRKLKSVFLISSYFLLMCNVFSLSLSLSKFRLAFRPLTPLLFRVSLGISAVCGSPSRREKGEEEEEKRDEEERVGFQWYCLWTQHNILFLSNDSQNGLHLPSLFFLLRLN